MINEKFKPLSQVRRALSATLSLGLGQGAHYYRVVHNKRGFKTLNFYYVFNQNIY